MICIDEANLVSIKEHGQKAYPEECCGILLGNSSPEGMRNVTELRPLVNQNQQSRRNRFLIQAEDMVAAEKYAREKGLQILGFYHSHPDVEARPSQFDLEHAWPWYQYIIVSIKQGYPDSLSAWELQEDRTRFKSVEISLSSNAACAAKENEHA
ncbi:MAG TPA: M67 family metallopeptidase [Acidobacteriota bacterium]|jgi:proteasome lid subunit RPN8/RPN11